MTTFGKTPKSDLLVEKAESLSINAVTWCITAFSEDILGKVATLAGLEATIRLFCTGSLLLRQKLSSPHCLLELRYSTKRGSSVQRLPPMISYLKGIKGLSMVFVLGSQNLTRFFQKSLSVLPITVTSLDCTSHNALHSSIVLLAKSFPNLTSLILSEQDPKQELPELLEALHDMNQLQVLSLSLATPPPANWSLSTTLPAYILFPWATSLETSC
jgi:hypothetical protein